ncbi:MAG: cell division ATP-binding protein FtsE [Methylococcales bacterium]|nr:cell division ATP-binding protein FtsE [Methylococcales bacterium]
MLKFDHVTKRYPDAGDALKDVSFQIEQGEIAFLTGHSGAGKSTLLKLIAVMELCSYGHIELDGQNLSQIRAKHIPLIRRNLGLIFQDNKLLNDRTVFDNVALPLVVSGYSFSEIARRVRAVLDKVGLSGREKIFPLALSGGEQQRVGIARAFVNKPKLILADEPTGNLDPELSAEIMNVFEQFQQVGVSVIIATHNAALVSKMGHRVLTLDHGHLIAS